MQNNRYSQSGSSGISGSMIAGLLGGVSLVGLLVTAAIYAYIWSTHTAAVAKTAKDLRGPVNQIAGRDEDGKEALDSITLTPGMAGSQLKSLNVTAIVAGGAMEKMYGLQAGDQIVEVGDYSIGMNDDFEMARIMFGDRGYKPGNPIKIRRGGREMTLQAAHSPQKDVNLNQFGR